MSTGPSLNSINCACIVGGDGRDCIEMSGHCIEFWTSEN